MSWCSRPSRCAGCGNHRSHRAWLWISSDRPDTDFTIKLVDVYPPNEDYPDGFAMNVTDGILRVRYRRSWERPQLLEAGEIAAITVEAFPTSNLFKRGHGFASMCPRATFRTST
jgi:predicted acyl esterase